MSIIVKINTVDVSSYIVWESLNISQNLTSLIDTAEFTTRKYGDRTFEPAYNDDIEIYNGSDKIFAGKVLNVEEIVEASKGVVYKTRCTDHRYEFDKLLVSKTYTNKTISEIIDDIITNFTPSGSGFTKVNATSTFLIEKIVFNQIRPSECLIRLATILQYDWYIDEDKDIHFFSKEINSAPFDLTDTSGNYVYKSLKRSINGDQITNIVKVRGGEYDGDSFVDSITVSGDDSKSFKLPYKMSNLTIELDTGGGFVSQTVGIDFIDDFTSVDVLHNFQDRSFRFENPLTAGDIIKFSGNPKIRVFAIAQNSDSVNAYGKIEKLIRENDIADNTLARKRAQAELLAYSEKLVDAQFTTYNTGLRTGMNIQVQSNERNSDDSLLIKTLTFKMIDPENFIYVAKCVSTKTVDFIELLQKIIAAEPLDIDEVETSEQIYATSEKMTINEDIEMTTPEEADESMTINENIIDNSSIAVEFVLAPYIPKDENLEGRWRLDDDEANTIVIDSSNNNNNGVLTGAGNTEDISTQGKASKGFLFNDSGEYVDLGNPASLQIGDNDQSIVAFVKLEAESGYIYSSRDGSSGELGLFVLDNGTLLATIGTTGQTQFGTEDIFDGNFHLIGIVYDKTAGTIKYYVDGINVKTDSSLTGSFSTSVNKRIGTRVGSSALSPKGVIDDVRIYSRKLSDTEMLSLSNNPLIDFGQTDTKRAGRLDISMQVY